MNKIFFTSITPFQWAFLYAVAVKKVTPRDSTLLTKGIDDYSYWMADVINGLEGRQFLRFDLKNKHTEIVGSVTNNPGEFIQPIIKELSHEHSKLF